MRPKKHFRWQQQRKEEKQRRERVKLLKEEIARTHSLIGRLDPASSHKLVSTLRRKLNTLQQRLRYINSTTMT